MTPSPDSKRRALLAVFDAMDHLGMANAAIHRARTELEGEVGHLTARMSVQVELLREVAELLCREIRGNNNIVPNIAAVSQPVRLEVVGRRRVST